MKKYIIQIVYIALMFFVLGFVSWVNSLLIPYFKKACELTHFESYLVAFAFYISYLVVSIPASYLLKAVGFKKGMSIALWVMALGAYMFIPAALMRSYPFFLAGLFVTGSGLSILQTAVNPYVTLLGPQKSAAQRISIMGICNKTAGIIAPLLLATFLIKSGDNELFKQAELLTGAAKDALLKEVLERVITPYCVVGTVLVALGIFIRKSSLPEIDSAETKEETETYSPRRIFRYPYLILGVVAIFLHVGSQIIAVDSIIAYGESMGLTMVQAKIFPSVILTTTIIGYIFGIVAIPKWISQVTAFRFCTLLGITLSLLVVLTNGWVVFMGLKVDISICFLFMLGLANSLIWAGIWPLAINGLGRYVKLGSSLLIMALCGNALMPLVYGYLGDRYGLQEAYWVLLPCYLYLAFYAFYGHKIKNWGKQNV